MPKVTVFDMAGNNVGEITLSDAVFGIEPNVPVMHAVVKNYLANHTRAGFDDRYGDHFAFFVKKLGHAELFAHDTFLHFSYLLRLLVGVRPT